MSTAPPPFPSIADPIDRLIKESIADTDTFDDNALKTARDSVSEVDKSIVTRSLNTILDSPENRNLIEENIKELAKKTLATRDAFEEISTLLHSFDREKLKTNNGTKISPLGPRWDDLYKRYNGILKKSYDDAVVIKGVCDDYIETVLAIPNEPGVILTDVKAEIDDFIKRTEEAKKVAEFDASSFDQLRQDINKLKEEIYDSFESANADPEGRISSLELQIKQLGKKISRLQESIMGIVIAYFGGAKGLEFVLLTMCPVLGPLFFRGIIRDAFHLEDLVENLKQDLKEKEESLVKLQARVSKLEDLKTWLHEMETPFEDIGAQLGALTNFWHSVDFQCREALVRLNKSKGATPFSTKKFLGDTLAGSSYRALSQALATYVSQMTQLK